jgi:serine/threonine protein kinase
MDDSSSSSNSEYESAASSNGVDRMDEDNDGDDDMNPEETTKTKKNQAVAEERAYWMQRTIREAIYGRVLFAVVLKRRPRSDDSSGTQAEWEVTDEHCAVKEMSWQHIRRERDRLAEDPIKEVSAMQFLKKWHEKTNGLSDAETNTHTSSFQAVMATNIMMPLDLMSDDRHLFSVMPYCDGGELFDRLDVNEKFSEAESRYWMHQILNVSWLEQELTEQ